MDHLICRLAIVSVSISNVTGQMSTGAKNIFNKYAEKAEHDFEVP